MIMQEIQLQLPPELQKDIDFIKSELEELKNNYEPKSPAEFLTRQQTADLLHVDLSTLWNWQQKSKLTPVGIAGSGRVLYRRTDIEKNIIELKK